MRQIDCGHDAGISATLAVELAGMVSPRGAWVRSPSDEDRQQDGGDAVGVAGGPSAVLGSPPARGGLAAVLEDRFPRDPSGVRSCSRSRVRFGIGVQNVYGTF